MPANSVKHTGCNKWIHKRCSVHGGLSLVVDGFRYNRCGGGGTQEPEDLVMDVETLDGDGRVDLAATAKIRNSWMKLREHLPFLISRAPPLEMKSLVYAGCVKKLYGLWK